MLGDCELFYDKHGHSRIASFNFFQCLPRNSILGHVIVLLLVYWGIFNFYNFQKQSDTFSLHISCPSLILNVQWVKGWWWCCLEDRWVWKKAGAKGSALVTGLCSWRGLWPPAPSSFAPWLMIWVVWSHYVPLIWCASPPQAQSKGSVSHHLGPPKLSAKIHHVPFKVGCLRHFGIVLGSWLTHTICIVLC